MQTENTGGPFSALPVVLGVSGYLLAAGILIVSDEGSWSDQVSYIFRNPAAVVWSTLVAIQLAACAALLPALVGTLREYPIPAGSARWKLAAFGVVAIILFGVFILAHRLTAANLELPVHHQRIKVVIIT